MDRIALAHGIEMQTGYAKFHQFPGLLNGPFNADLFSRRIVLACCNCFSKRFRNIDVEYRGKQADLGHGCDWLNARNDGHIDANRPAFFNKGNEPGVIEKHLGYDILRSEIDFLFQVAQVGLEVGRSKMLFRIAGYTDAEGGRMGVCKFLVDVNPTVHIHNLADQTGSKWMTIGFWGEPALVAYPVALQGQNIIDAKIVEVDQGILGLLF